MDPNEAMKTIQREIRQFDLKDNAGEDFDATDLVEAVRALDQWLMQGGFLPTRWKR